LQDRLDLVFPGEIVPPFGWDSRLTEPGAGKLAADGTRGVGVITQIHGSEHSLAEIVRIIVDLTSIAGFLIVSGKPRNMSPTSGQFLILASCPGRQPGSPTISFISL